MMPRGIGISAGFNAGKAEGKGKGGERQPDTVLSSPGKIDEHASSQIGTSKSVGFGLDSEKDSSTTHSGINTQNINIRDDQAQQALTDKTAEQIKADIYTEVTTDTARENSGAIANNFDKDKVLSEINLQVNVTKEFRENSLSLVDEYASHKQAELRDKIKQATSEDEKTAIYEEIYKVQYQRGFLETLVGIVTLNPDVAITQGTLQLAATKMRENTLANSRLFPPIIDEKTGMKLSNVSYDSGYFDGVKLGGVRLDLDAICGINDERCTQSGNGSYAYVGDSNFPTLADAINPEKNVKAKGMYGPTGGLQAIQGSMFGSYLPGGWQDTGVESFAGTHDFIGGQIWGWYDGLGNTSRGRDKPGNHDGILSTVTTIVAIPVSAPFALTDVISPDIIQLIFNIAGR